MPQETKKFYRVPNKKTEQGLWYDFKGNFTGLIHNEYNFCANKDLAMDFDEELVGFLSAAHDLETLFFWFPKQDILKLQEHGYSIHVYESSDYKFYERFQHFVISQQNSKLIKEIILNDV